MDKDIRRIGRPYNDESWEEAQQMLRREREEQASERFAPRRLQPHAMKLSGAPFSQSSNLSSQQKSDMN